MKSVSHSGSILKYHIGLSLFHNHDPSTFFMFIFLFFSQIGKFSIIEIFISKYYPDLMQRYFSQANWRKNSSLRRNVSATVVNSLRAEVIFIFSHYPAQCHEINIYWIFMNERVKWNQLIWKRPSFVGRVSPFAFCIIIFTFAVEYENPKN